MISSLSRISYSIVLIIVLISPSFTSLSLAHTSQDGSSHCHINAWGKEYCH